MILPEPDATRRIEFEEWFVEANGHLPSVAIETAGWLPALEFAHAGLGVALATRQTLLAYQDLFGSRKKLELRLLDMESDRGHCTRLVTRKSHGKSVPDLTDVGQELFDHIVAEAKEMVRRKS